LSKRSFCSFISSVQVVRDLWNRFVARFCDLWTQHGAAGALTPAAVFGADAAARAAAQTAFVRDLLPDALLFGGCVMIRRLVGIAHNADFEAIEDADVRAVCEARALRLGRELAVRRHEFASIEAVAEASAAARADGREPCYPALLSPHGA
jgi:5-methylthioribose kinase